MIAFVKDMMIYIFVIAAIIVIPAQLGGYRRDLRRRRQGVRGQGRRHRNHAATGPGHGVRDAGARLGVCVVPVSALRSPARSPRRAANVIRRNAMLLPMLQRRARPDRAARLHGDCRACRRERHGRRAGPDHAKFPGMVCRILLRRDRARRAGAGGDHVDRRGQSGHAQYLAAVRQSQHERQAGIHRRQGDLAGSQVRRAEFSSCSCRSTTRSTCNCSAASGCCRSSRRSCSVCSRAGSGHRRCWSAGRVAHAARHVAELVAGTPNRFRSTRLPASAACTSA